MELTITIADTETDHPATPLPEETPILTTQGSGQEYEKNVTEEGTVVFTLGTKK